MSLRRVNPESLDQPNRFSPTVLGSGTVVFLSGPTTLDGPGRLVGDGVVEQFELALSNLLEA
ncbi:MAG: RidA family protein, partial [Jatrophihabitans sp.]